MMKCLSILIAVVAMGYNLSGQNLTQHKWKDRVLVVEAHSIEVNKYQDQIEQFKDAIIALADRNIIIYKIVGDQYQMIDYNADANKMEWQGLSDSFDKSLVDGELFRVRLIGLDGGVKLNRIEVLSQKELYSIVDAMPMRSTELRKRKSKKNND